MKEDELRKRRGKREKKKKKKTGAEQGDPRVTRQGGLGSEKVLEGNEDRRHMRRSVGLFSSALASMLHAFHPQKPLLRRPCETDGKGDL